MRESSGKEWDKRGFERARPLRNTARGAGQRIVRSRRLHFEPNVGQSDPRVKFLARAGRYRVSLAGAKAAFFIHGDANERGALRLEFAGAASGARLEGADAQAGKIHYLIGRDPSRWRTNVPTYARVRARGIYPGVDLEYYGGEDALEYDLIVKPGGNPRSIRLRAGGADSMQIDQRGDVLLRGGPAELRLRKPQVYQDVNGALRGVAAHYVSLSAQELGFEVGAYDAAHPLVIDPTLVYSSYLGGSATDEANAIAIDSSGNIYLTGETSSNNFPTRTGGAQGTFGGGFSDAFVTKFDPTGTSLLFSTYLGGNDEDVANAIRVDAAGNVYLAGHTKSSNFPVTPRAVQSTFAGGSIGGDAFVAKLNATGSGLVYATYLGGSDTDGASDLVVDGTGNAYVVGSTRSGNFPVTPGALQRSFGGGASNVSGFGGDAFVAQLDATGTSLVYSTFLGGRDEDSAGGIVLDALGNAYVVGSTKSSNFAVTPGVFQSSFRGGQSIGDAFVAKLNPQGSALVFSTYLGGSGEDASGSVALDSSGNVWLAGSTESTDFPTASPIQASNRGRRDAFLAKLSPSANSLLFSTYYGGSDTDSASLILAPTGDIYLYGLTFSFDFPLTNPLQPYFGDDELFVAKIRGTTMSVSYSTYLGGSNADIPGGATLDPAGDFWLAGTTFSRDFPVLIPYQNAFGGGFDDVLLLKLSDANPPQTGLAADLNVTVTSSRSQVDPGGSFDYSVNIKNNGPDAAANVVLLDPMPSGFTLSRAQAGQGSCTTSSTGDTSYPTLITCNLGTINSGASVAVTFNAQGSLSGAFAGPVRNTFRAFSSTRDPNLGDNSSTISVTLGNPPSSPPGNISISGKGCFIATAAFGSELEPHVRVLREFRDRHLLSNAAGRAFVRVYCRTSPQMAAVIARYAVLRAFARFFLRPVVCAVEFPFRAGLALVLSSALLCLAWSTRRRRRLPEQDSPAQAAEQDVRNSSA